jgi:hypothetical protein
MRDEWFPHIAFPIPIEQFHQIPKSPLYKWEYWNGEARLSARPKSYHCLLDLKSGPVADSVIVHRNEILRIRPLNELDWDQLPEVFSAAFSHIVPFCGMEDLVAMEAARCCLDRTRIGGEGPLVEQACFVAANQNDEPCGAALITLTRDIDLTSLDRLHWETPPDRALERGLGRPHLTWVFVPPLLSRHGVGSAMLGHAVNALVKLSYHELGSTFWLGNESSALWHWMNGFRLVSWVGSPRAMDCHLNKDHGGAEDNSQRKDAADSHG